MKTSELTGPALDWAVAKCEGEDYRSCREYDGIDAGDYPAHEYSTNWAQGGPIIDREWDNLMRWFYLRSQKEEDGDMWHDYMLNGQPVLQAFMQAFVASTLGDEVDIPEELI